MTNNNSYFSNIDIDTETQPYLLLSDKNSEVNEGEYQEGYNKAVEDACEAFSKILIDLFPSLNVAGTVLEDNVEIFKTLIYNKKNTTKEENNGRV